MAEPITPYWKQLWRWVTSENIRKDDIKNVLGKKDVVNCLKLGLASYNPLRVEEFTKLQSKQSEQTKLLNVVQTLQNYIDVDCFQIWELIKHYLCDISYGTPENALKNVAFVDTRPSFLSPNVWNFYYAERLYLLKLLQYIVEHKSDDKHKYNEQFNDIFNEIGLSNLKSSLISQFEKILSTPPPSRKIQNDFNNDTVRQDWAKSNLREQVAILQILMLIAKEHEITQDEFISLFKLFRKHDFGKNQGFNDLLEERHREMSCRVMYMEIGLFMVICDGAKIKNLSSWIEYTKSTVESEFTKLQPSTEQSPMLMTWMMLTLQSEQHLNLFETQYQHYGATALRMKVFEFIQQMLNNTVYNDDSVCAQVMRNRVFRLLNEICNKFDGDGTISCQPGIMHLCADLIKCPEIAGQFWDLQQKDDVGVVSLWNTALEYFPFNFSALSVLSAGLANAGQDSVRNLIAELKNLPIFTELYNPQAVPIKSLQAEDAIIGRDYYPLNDKTYRIEAGSQATIMERKEGTMIHFRTPFSYWTVFNKEIEKALDRTHRHQDINVTLEKVYGGTKVLKGILKALVDSKEIPKSLVGPSEGVFDVLVRFMRAETPPLPLLVECLEVCTTLIPVFSKEIYRRLINTGLLPRVTKQQLSYTEYATGVSLESGAVGSYLVTLEQPTGTYKFLTAYIDMLSAFLQAPIEERIIQEVILPGTVLLLREVFPNVYGWRYRHATERRVLIHKCVCYFFQVLNERSDISSVTMLRKTCVYGMLYTENALELLKIVSIGNESLERLIHDDANWSSGSGYNYAATLHRCVALVMYSLRLKPLLGLDGMSPMEQFICAQNKQIDSIKVVPNITSFISNAFNRRLAMLSCRLLNTFAEGFKMSLFALLDMTAYQTRVFFLDRLRDKYERRDIQESILDFVATCIGKQPSLTEAFFVINHVKAKAEETEKEKDKKEKPETDESYEGILGYMATYLGHVKSDVKQLHNPILERIMALFHALWKNNMQILVKKLRENPQFWDYMTSPLFSDIEPRLRTYSQIFNVLGIELFVSREKLDPNFKEVLERLFDTNKKHLDTWIDYIFSFKGRDTDIEYKDEVPVWLGLLTSWKDFTTIFCKCLPFSLNIAHKAKMVAPCMSALLKELNDLRDGRLVVILAELYVTMLANWKDDCFENRKASAKQIEKLLSNTAAVYESLHPRAIKAILSIATVAISSLDYEIKANCNLTQSMIQSVTHINSFELQNLFDNIKDDSKKVEDGEDELPPIVLALAMLEQCLDLYDDVFCGLLHWFQSTKFINKLLCCLQITLHNKRHQHTSLAALRCLTAYARGPFSKDLLLSDVDQFLWMQLLPPKIEVDGKKNVWKPQEWWRVYGYSLDFISMMVMKHGQFFAGDAVTFVGVHLEYLVEAILLPRQMYTIEALNLCASTLNLIVQLVKYEARWRTININSLICIMRSISACVYQCVMLILRSRRSLDAHAPDDVTLPSPAALHRVLEILHMATLCLLAFSPDLLSLLADPVLDLERWQPLVELHFGAPKITYEHFPQLTFGTLLSAVCILTRSLNHTYHSEETSGSRSPRGRRRACSCSHSPGERRVRSESVASAGSASALPAADHRLLAAALQATLTLLASQALLAVRDPSVPSRHKQLVRRELASELTVYHDFVRKRILCAAHARPHLMRNKLGAWPLDANEEEVKRIEEARHDSASDTLPPPPPPKRSSQDSMREFILRKHFLDKCAQTPTKDPPSPVSHSTPTSDKKREVRSLKRVSWAETTQDSADVNTSLQELEMTYSNLTDVQINNDEDYFHFMSVVFLYICQTDL